MFNIFISTLSYLSAIKKIDPLCKWTQRLLEKLLCSFPLHFIRSLFCAFYLSSPPPFSLSVSVVVLQQQGTQNKYTGNCTAEQQQLYWMDPNSCILLSNSQVKQGQTLNHWPPSRLVQIFHDDFQLFSLLFFHYQCLNDLFLFLFFFFRCRGKVDWNSFHKQMNDLSWPNQMRFDSIK